MIRVLLFAQLKEQLNRPEILIEKKEISVGQLREALQKNDLLQASSVMVAVNEEFASDEEIIRDGDVVALIPPVSGG